jgi:predicted GNAT family acetyltransferase
LSSTLQVVRHANARTFLERAETWLVAAEMEYGSALTSARNARADDSRYQQPVYWATVEDGGKIVGCAFRTPPFRLGVTAMSETAIAAVLANVASVYPTLSGVSGPDPTSSVIAEAWCRLRGSSAEIRVRQRLHSLRVLVPPTRLPGGALRAATEADAPIVRAWGEAFIREASVEGVDADFFAQLIRARYVYVWDDGEPRCLAAAIRQTPKASAIGVLFTPKALRGRGYGTAAVAALSAGLFGGGAKGCYLWADPANNAVNRIVGGLGFQRVHDYSDFDFR